MKSNALFFCVVFLAVLIGGLVVIGVGRGWFGFRNDPIVKKQDDDSLKQHRDDGSAISVPRGNAKPLNEVLGLDENDIVVAGGVERQRSAVEFSEVKKTDYGQSNPLPFTGLPARVDLEANETTRRFKQDLSDPNTRKLATSIYAQVEAFDPAAYRSDPNDYLLKTRPARVNQVATASDGVVPLRSESPMFISLIQGEKVNLRLAGEPGMPLTLHCNQIGSFENGLKTISIAFGPNGKAVASFETGPGSAGLINVLAASPVHSGQLKYVIRVRVPNS